MRTFHRRYPLLTPIFVVVLLLTTLLTVSPTVASPPTAAPIVAAAPAAAPQPAAPAGAQGCPSGYVPGWVNYPGTVSNPSRLYGVSSSDSSTVWAVGSTVSPTLRSLALRWDGSTWLDASPPEYANAATSAFYAVATTVRYTWAVGTYTNTAGFSRSLISRFDNSTGLQRYYTVTGELGNRQNILRGVVADDEFGGNVYAVGYWNSTSAPNLDKTLVVRYNSGTDSFVADTSSNVGLLSNRLLAAGTDGLIGWGAGYYMTDTLTAAPLFVPFISAFPLNYVPLPRWSELHGAVSTAPNEFVAVGYGYNSNPLLREPLVLTGTSPSSFVRASLPLGNYMLNDVDHKPSYNLWAVGSLSMPGNISRTIAITSSGFGTGVWQEVSPPSPVGDHVYFYGVSVQANEDVWAVGGYIPAGVGGDRAYIAHYTCLPFVSPTPSTITPSPTPQLTSTPTAIPSPTPQPRRWRRAPVLTASVNIRDFDFVPNPNFGPGESINAAGTTAWAVADRAVLADEPTSGNGVIIVRDQGVWRVYSTTLGVTLRAVYMISPTLGYAVGDEGKIVNFDGNTWAVADSPTNNDLLRLERNPANGRLFAVGEAGALLRKNNPLNPTEPWVVVALPTSYDMKDIAFAPDGTGFCVGQNGTMLRFDGITWTNYTLPYTDTFTGVSLRQSNDGVAVSAEGHIFNWDGSGWQPVYTNTNLLGLSIGTDRKGQWVDGISSVAVGRKRSNPTQGLIAIERKGQWVDSVGQYPALNRVGADPDGNLWAVGDGATVITYDSCLEFGDVPENYLFYQYIHPLTCIGAVSGLSEGVYGVSGQATRAQFAKMATISFGLPAFTPTTPTFYDVPTSYFAYTYIESAVANGLVGGYPPAQCDGTRVCFKPNNPISRAEIALIVRRARAFPLFTPTLPTFVDVQPNYFAYSTIETLYQHGIISGAPCGGGLCFRPNSNVRRDELAKFLWLGLSRP